MFSGTLLPYQVDDVDRMVSTHATLVAYEMGLGKTPMTIAAVEKLREQGKVHQPTLVIVLSSLKYQWQTEVHKFTDRDAIVINGTPKQRAEQWKAAQFYEYVVLSYSTATTDRAILRKFTYDAVIIDEATAIKGFRAVRSKVVKELGGRCRVRFALTGTPLENGRPEEVYSIMQFVNPRVLGRFDYFDEEYIVRNAFGGVQYYRRLPELQAKLATATVRKRQSDDDVAPYLPSAVHRNPLLVKLDAKSQKLYNHIAKELLTILYDISELGGGSFSLTAHYGEEAEDTRFNPLDPMNELRGAAMARVMALRMLCSHPGLLHRSAEEYDKKGKLGGAYLSSLRDAGLLEGVSKTVKLDAAAAFLQEHLDIDPSYKGVVFSSYPYVVQKLADKLNAAGYSSLIYTGDLNAKQKEVAKVKFQTDPKVRLLISSDAGGYGVDLPQANLLLNYDQPWQAGLKVQRNSRVKRASSLWKTVTIQDIFARNTIEQHQFNMLNQKTAVSDAVIDGSGINSAGGVDLTAGSLTSFITAQIA